MQKQQSQHLGHRQRLRERYQKGGISALADYEFVELFLMMIIPRVDVKPIAKTLIKKYKNIRGIIEADSEDLKKIEGLGESSSLSIKLIKDLLTTCHLNDLEMPTREISTISKLISYFRSKLASKKCEILEMLSLDSQLKVIPSGAITLFEGSVNTSKVDIRKIIETAISKGASSIAIAHNHPSGNPNPSFEDIRLTKKISEACKPINLNFIEHVIVGKNVCFSFRRDGKFDCLYDENIEEGRLRGYIYESDEEQEAPLDETDTNKISANSSSQNLKIG